jgi:phage protein
MVFLMWDKIEKQLKIKGWSMYRLAKESNVHPSNLSNLKAGRMKEMSWTNMCKVADALGISIDELR